MVMNQEDKNRTETNTLLQTDVSNVFVVRNSKKRPFIEHFEHTSVNFTQKNLGTILGFFIVRDDSPTSENIVNFLASEVKKHYFAPTEKSAEEKFESTLHHVNRALEEIANIGNVEWLGTIEGAVCVIENSSIHFSVTGNAHILLLRDDTLINISEGLASTEAASYPLKTFMDISSGDICSHDKIIITSQELLDLIPFEELQKNALRMGQKNFIQFIETALTNECPIASATIIDITKEERKQPLAQPEEVKKTPENFFAADTFEKTLGDEEVEDVIDIENLQIEDAPKEYTDPRTGHIHIQGDDEVIEKPTIIETTQEKFVDIFEVTQAATQKKIRLFSKKITAFRKKEAPTSSEYDQEEKMEKASAPILQRALPYIKTLSTHFLAILKKGAKKTHDYCMYLLTRIRDMRKSREFAATPTTQNPSTGVQERVRKILPSVNHITNLWHSMNNKTKLSAFGIIAFVVLAPLIFSLFTTKTSEEILAPEQEVATEEVVHESPATPADTVQNTIPDPATLYESSAIHSIILLRDIPVGIEKNAINIFNEDQKNFPLPDDAGTIAHVAPMDDLNMIFFITDKDRLYSFSPISKKYQEQKNFPEPDHTKIIQINTYLTYLYVLDEKMITRHTRIENGFDEGKKWLKDSYNFSNATSIAINEDIYTAQNNNITKFIKGKNQNYTKNTDIEKPRNLYATEDTDFVWILDTENLKLFKTNKSNGDVIETFLHSDFSQATSFAVDEEKNTAFISTPDKTLQFSLKN